MNIYIISTSYNGFDWAREGITTYSKRIQRFAKIKALNIKPQKLTSAQTTEAMHADNISIRQKITRQSHVILCHADGKQYDSLQFSKMLEETQLSASSVTFVLGPSYGLSPLLLSDFPKLSLSKMTLQHEIAEVVLYEQIYRALTIMNRHPYHR